MGQEVKSKFKETVKSTKELLIAIEAATRQQVKIGAPKLANGLDKSLEQGSKALSDFIGSLDKKTSKEQLELLKGYRFFLGKQLEMVQGRISAIEGPRSNEQQS